MKKRSTVRGIIKVWETAKIEGVTLYLEETEPVKGSWAEKIKRLLKDGYIKSVEKEIELVAFNFNPSKTINKTT